MSLAFPQDVGTPENLWMCEKRFWGIVAFLKDTVTHAPHTDHLLGIQHQYIPNMLSALMMICNKDVAHEVDDRFKILKMSILSEVFSCVKVA